MNAANTNMNIYIHEAQEYKLRINNTETRSLETRLYKRFKQRKWLTLTVFLTSLARQQPQVLISWSWSWIKTKSPSDP